MNQNAGDFYITTQSQLDSLLNNIKAEKLVALDTEFTRQTTYYPILSIIQVAIKVKGEKKSYIIDCLSNLDLRDFFAVISDKEIIKILHSCAQDLQIFYLGSKQLPQAVVDSQVMANFCDFGTNVGYSNLVKKIFNKELNKDQQRSDWQRRPLSAKQVNYALTDVEFLHEIYEKFSEILQKNGRQKWFAEEMEKFIEKSLFKPQENLFKNFSLKHKSAQQKAQLKNLVLWREELAQQKNLIRQFFIKDEDVEKIIDHGFDAKRHPRLSKSMIESIESIMASEEEDSEFSNNFAMNEQEKKLLEAAKELVEKIAKDENLSPQFLLTASDLKKLICQKEQFEKHLNGWRYDLIGRELKNLIS